MAPSPSDPPTTSPDSRPPRELELGFWKLVLLVKLVIVIVGAGFIVLVATAATVVGIALIGIAALIGLRGAIIYRQLQQRHGSDS